MTKSISISGYRGYKRTQKIDFAILNGKIGSGLTFIVGANNSGKTTITEAIKAFNGLENEAPSFSVDKRNNKSNGIVEISLVDNSNDKCVIKTIESGGSSTTKTPLKKHSSYVLPSRRFINHEFSLSDTTRENYLYHYNKLASITHELNNFYLCLAKIQKNKEQFNALLKDILGEDIKWVIDQNNNNNYFINYTFNGISHNSEGIGDGIWSIFTICDALYDSLENSTVVIDEPELSIHPSIQKRLVRVLIQQAKNKQIILSTHSPYFINWESIINGANLIRTTKECKGGIRCFGLSDATKNKFRGLFSDLNNPHVLGLNANEVFFLQDKIILVEGQEDIIIFKKICDTIGLHFKGDFFGWGVGGASKMNIFLSLFSNLGYKKIVAIYNKDKNAEMEADKQQFPNFNYVILPTDDIRDKEQKNIKVKIGLTNNAGELKEEYKEYMNGLIASINTFFE